jgi:hypothetical protein
MDSSWISTVSMVTPDIYPPTSSELSMFTSRVIIEDTHVGTECSINSSDPTKCGEIPLTSCGDPYMRKA